MAASAWIFYTVAKKHLMDGGFNLDTDIFRLGLFRGSAGSTATGNITSVSAMTLKSSITGEVTNGNGYLTHGKTLSATTWAVGTSANQYRFDATAVIWTAGGGAISAIRYGLIFRSASAGGGINLCYAPLTTTPFDLTNTNTLTVTPANPNGIFQLA